MMNILVLTDFGNQQDTDDDTDDDVLRLLVAKRTTTTMTAIIVIIIRVIALSGRAKTLSPIDHIPVLEELITSSEVASFANQLKDEASSLF